MQKYNLLIIYRNFKRNKSTYFINLIGLSTGIACALLIYLWVDSELKIDNFDKNDSQLYQVLSNYNYTTGIITEKATTAMLVQTLAKEMPEIEYTACYDQYGNNILLSNKDKNVRAEGVFASKDYFKVFPFRILSGNKDNVLSNNENIVISKKLAVSLFQTTENIIGKQVQIEHDKKYFVSGVFEDMPANSTQQFNFILSFEGLVQQYPKAFSDWGNTAPRTFIVLKKHTNIARFQNKIRNFIAQNSGNSNTTLTIQPYSETYLYNNYENGVQSGGRIEYVKLFSVIALIILIIASINFMNLSTAKASGRIKEVGIKKSIGASRKTLIIQYLQESVLMTFAALIVAIILAELLLPQFNEIIGKQLDLNFNLTNIFSILGLTIFIGILSGSYPALYLSGFNPIAILKGKIKNSPGERWIRQGLVVFQFSISIILITAVIIVYKQIEFIQSNNLGFNKDNVVYFMADGKLADNKDTFISEIKNIPGIVYATSTDHNLIGHVHTTGLIWEGKKDENISFEFANVNYDIISTLGLKLIEGRSFSKNYGDEHSNILLNEAAVDAMGIKNPIGKIVNQWGENKTIIGVIKNFHFESLHEKIKPMFFAFDPKASSIIMARIKAGTEKETLSRLQGIYQTYNPGFPFDYKFLDQDFQALYTSEYRVSVLSKYFACVAIIISSLGLFGLSAFTAERRRKEIGIRKVLGSSELRIIYLLSSDFTKLVFISIIVALPLSYIITKHWLNSFAYKAALSPWYFIGAGLIALIIAWFTVGVHAIKAATSNPVKSLKYE